MSQIKIYITENMIEIEGHAQPDVCAAISSIMYTAVNIMNHIDEEAVSFEDDGRLVIIQRLKRSNELDASWDTMIRMFKDAEEMSEGQVLINDIHSKTQRLS